MPVSDNSYSTLGGGDFFEIVTAHEAVTLELP